MLDAVEEAPGARAPARRDLEPATLELIERHGPEILRTARRYSRTAEDAEDAYQRGLEILLTKAPSSDEADLVPWLKTVVKHEAFTVQRQRDRNGAGTDDGLDRAATPTTTDEQVEQRERFLIGAEALGKLKANEVRCLLLLADGMTYRQIAEAEGWSYTKVNRLATEGRRAFRDGVARIESGGECERMAPKLSALADGEAAAQDMPDLRRHLRGCRACRVTLGEFRATPARVAALAPPIIEAAASDSGGVSGVLSSATGWIQERTYSLVLKVQALTEATTANKTAAVAASTAVLAGGGVGAVKSLESRVPDDERSASAESTPWQLRSRAPARLKPPSTLGRPRVDEISRPDGESVRGSVGRSGAGGRGDSGRRASARRRADTSRESSGGAAGEFSGAETYSPRTQAPRTSSTSSTPSASSGASGASSGGGTEFGGRVESRSSGGGSSSTSTRAGEFGDR